MAGAVQKKPARAHLAAIAAAHPEAERVELRFADEAGVGRKGRVTRVWYERGVRPRAARGARDLGFAPAWLFGAVCPRSGTPASPRSCRPVLPAVSTAAMNLTLAELAYGLPPATHAVVVLDRAGWHTGAELKVPPNLTPVPLPACSPVGLNPIEQVWRYLRDRYPSHRLSRDRGAVVEACRRAWDRPVAERGRVRSLAAFPWLPSRVTPS